MRDGHTPTKVSAASSEEVSSASTSRPWRRLHFAIDVKLTFLASDGERSHDTLDHDHSRQDDQLQHLHGDEGKAAGEGLGRERLGQIDSCFRVLRRRGFRIAAQHRNDGFRVHKSELLHLRRSTREN